MTRKTDQLRLADDYMEFACGCEAATVGDTFIFRPHALDCEVYRYVQDTTVELAKPLVTLKEKPAPGCVECGNRNDDFTAINNDTKPHVGAISICVYCGHVAVFTGDGLTLRELTSDERPEVMADPEVIAAVRSTGRPG